ncbi:E3 ubiquitin-protein ligase RNF139-like [Paralichthys olivaceus]|uniref:E3 ubiquitin-protein ligase RNF139-like n=1 Tax=Paralichthys olivaceus TaxID=8255 RepID=UPI0037506D41
MGTLIQILGPEINLVTILDNYCLVMAILHIIHSITDSILMFLCTSQFFSFRRHVPYLLLSLTLFLLPIELSYTFWQDPALNDWLSTVIILCLGLCFKVMVSLTVYSLYIVDSSSDVLWENLDDYVYYVSSTGDIIQLLLSVIFYGNGAYTMMVMGANNIHVSTLCLFAFLRIYLHGKTCLKKFINHRRALKKIEVLPEISGDQLRDINDSCAICHQEFATSARITPCHHYFHAVCMRKWLIIQNTCPICHRRVEKRSRRNREAQR